MAVKVIEATKQRPGHAPASHQSEEGFRVAAYCRVSTDSDEQESSYQAQCRHYADYIAGQPGWELAGIYADEGISGTSTRRREQFNRMIADCEAGKIDMVITKSISRWARNTIDSLENIRRLKELGIPVLFEKENINTMDVNGEVLITIMSSLAQQESDSISKNVRIGIQYLMQQGKGRLNTAQFLGLTKDMQTGQLVIVPEEAPLVRRIYREYLDGYSPAKIAERLTAEKIPTPAGKNTWYQSTIVSILENEKYAGDLLLQKYYVEDFLTHRIIKNTGQLPRYFVEDNHEPIIPKEVYFQVQGEMQRRALLKTNPSSLRFGSFCALRGRLICGLCGRTLKRCAGPEDSATDWRCRKRSHPKKTIDRQAQSSCPCRILLETDARADILAAFNQLFGHRDELLRLQNDLRDREIAQSDTAPETIWEWKRQGMQVRMLLELLDVMEEKRERALRQTDEQEETNHFSPACYDSEDFFYRTRYLPAEGILGSDGTVQIFSDEMIVRYLDKAIVHADRLEVHFKAGIVIEV